MTKTNKIPADQRLNKELDLSLYPCPEGYKYKFTKGGWRCYKILSEEEEEKAKAIKVEQLAKARKARVEKRQLQEQAKKAEEEQNEAKEKIKYTREELLDMLSKLEIK